MAESERRFGWGAAAEPSYRCECWFGCSFELCVCRASSSSRSAHTLQIIFSDWRPQIRHTSCFTTFGAAIRISLCGPGRGSGWLREVSPCRTCSLNSMLFSRPTLLSPDAQEVAFQEVGGFSPHARCNFDGPSGPEESFAAEIQSVVQVTLLRGSEL